MTGVGAEREAPPTREVEESASTDRLRSISWIRAITAAILGLLLGGVAAWATMNLGIAGIAFVVVFAAATYYLYQKPLPSAEAAGTFIGSVMGLVIWGFVFLLLAVVVTAIGWFAGRRAKKKLNKREEVTATAAGTD